MARGLDIPAKGYFAAPGRAPAACCFCAATVIFHDNRHVPSTQFALERAQPMRDYVPTLGSSRAISKRNSGSPRVDLWTLVGLSRLLLPWLTMAHDLFGHAPTLRRQRPSAQ